MPGETRVMRVVGWTGHRPDLFADPIVAHSTVDAALDELLRDEPPIVEILVGGQRGVDQWAALAARAHGIPYHVVLPLRLDLFAAGWTRDERDLLEDLLSTATTVRVIGGADPAAAYTERNRLIATASDLLIAVWTGVAGGGTAETLAFALSAGTPVREFRLPAAPGAERASGRGI